MLISEIIFLISTLIVVFYYTITFTKLLKINNKHKLNNYISQTISIVICGFNEAENIKKNLTSVLKQFNPITQKSIEVVFVSDGSTDESVSILEEFSQKHDNLKIVEITQQNKTPGKKQALLKGIENAWGDIVVLTDADCKPTGNNWAFLMAQPFSNDKIDIVLGYAPYNFKNKFVNWLVFYETTLTAIQYLSLALCKMPYMGVGRNIAYRKSFFLKHKFNNHPQGVSSGDDDLFVNRNATKHNTTIVIDEDAQCFSDAPQDLLHWYKQKFRHLSTGKYYKINHKFILAIFAFAQTLSILSFLCNCFISNHFTLVFLLLIFKISIQFIVLKLILKKLNRKNGVVILLFIEFLHPLYYILFVNSIFINKKIKWN